MQRGQIAHRHVVGAVRPHTETPQRETREAGAVREQHLQVFGRHRLALAAPWMSTNCAG
jgi:hypothetical protein